MSTEKIVEQALKLPARQRFEIAEQLLRSLDKPDPEIERIWGEEAARRLQAYHRGELETVALDEALVRS